MGAVPKATGAGAEDQGASEIGLLGINLPSLPATIPAGHTTESEFRFNQNKLLDVGQGGLRGSMQGTGFLDSGVPLDQWLKSGAVTDDPELVSGLATTHAGLRNPQDYPDSRKK